ncbi:MAG: hypothetical protein WC346_01270 [Methanogenium sp.]|jgi:hypothetical protein
MLDLTPQYEIVPMKEKVVVDSGDFGTLIGGLTASSNSITRGSGDDSFTVNSVGLFMGNAEFASAPFSVDMQGNLVATSLSVTGGIIKYGKTAFDDDANAGYYISSEGFYVGDVSDASALKYTVTTGSFDFVGTISSRSTDTVASAIDASGYLITDLINARLDTSTKTILSDFDFGSTDYAGALLAGNVTWDSGTGAITGGSGVVIYRKGIVGVASGVATFTIDSTTGNATFAGTLSAASGTLGAITVGSNAFHVDSSGNMWWGNFASYAAATNKISTTGVANLSGLTVGTNVGLGTAMDSASTTTLIGATVTASYISTLGLVVGSQIGQGTARQVFTSTPTTPYYVGDLWAAGSSGDLKRCSTQRLSGAYVSGDWDLASKYTDDSGVTTIIGSTVTTSYVNALNITALGTVTTGTLNGVLIQTSASAYTGVKLSSALGGVNCYGLSFNLYAAGSSTLYGYIGGDAGYYKMTTVSNRNMFLSAGSGVIFSDSDFCPLTDGVAMLGDSDFTWNTVYAGNARFSNLYLNAGTTSPSAAGQIRNFASGATDQFRGVPGDGVWVGSFDMTAV